MTDKAGSNHAQRELFETATQISELHSPFAARFGTPRLISIGIHGVVAGLALLPWTPAIQVHPKLSQTAVVLYTPTDILIKRLPLPTRPSGGGGGGKHQPTPASHGALPRGADKQLAPPDPEPPKNPDPTLIVEPTVVAPQLALLRRLDLLSIGDPNGISGPPSSGPGTAGGIGAGNGRGDGNGDGPG